jgi:gas vesicle protein
MGNSSPAAALTAGLVAGALAGAAVALLFAPRPGNEIRSSIRHFASDRRQQMSRLIETGRTRAGDAVHRASNLIEKGRHAFRTKGRTWSTDSSTSGSGAQPLTASVADITGADRRFEEPMGG